MIGGPGTWGMLQCYCIIGCWSSWIQLELQLDVVSNFQLRLLMGWWEPTDWFLDSQKDSHSHSSPYNKSHLGEHLSVGEQNHSYNPKLNRPQRCEITKGLGSRFTSVHEKLTSLPLTLCSFSFASRSSTVTVGPQKIIKGKIPKIAFQYLEYQDSQNPLKTCRQF